MLWLLRHAEAADGQPDDDRPLTERGLQQAESAGRALARLGTNIDACLCSPKLRAVQTAQRVCEQLGVEVTIDPALSGEPFDVHGLVAGLGDVLFQQAELDYLVHSTAAATALAENYVGLPL